MSISRSRRGCPQATLELMEELQVIKKNADQPFSERMPLNYILSLLEFYHTLEDQEKKFILIQNVLNSLHEFSMKDRWFVWDNHMMNIIDIDYAIHESTLSNWSCHFEEEGDGRLMKCPVLCEIWRRRTLKLGDDNFHLQDKCTCEAAA
jgi:hypothetical protein